MFQHFVSSLKTKLLNERERRNVKLLAVEKIYGENPDQIIKWSKTGVSNTRPAYLSKIEKYDNLGLKVRIFMLFWQNCFYLSYANEEIESYLTRYVALKAFF